MYWEISSGRGGNKTVPGSRRPQGRARVDGGPDRAPHDAKEGRQLVLTTERRRNPSIVVAGSARDGQRGAERDRISVEPLSDAEITDRHNVVLDVLAPAEAVLVLDAELPGDAPVQVDPEAVQLGNSGGICIEREGVARDGEVGAGHCVRVEPEADEVEPVAGSGRPRSSQPSAATRAAIRVASNHRASTGRGATASVFSGFGHNIVFPSRQARPNSRPSPQFPPASQNPVLWPRSAQQPGWASQEDPDEFRLSSRAGLVEYGAQLCPHGIHRDAELAGGFGKVLALKQAGSEAGLGARQPVEASQEIGRASRFLLGVADKDDRRRPACAVGEPLARERRYQDGQRLGARRADSEIAPPAPMPSPVPVAAASAINRCSERFSSERAALRPLRPTQRPSPLATIASAARLSRSTWPLALTRATPSGMRSRASSATCTLASSAPRRMKSWTERCRCGARKRRRDSSSTVERLGAIRLQDTPSHARLRLAQQQCQRSVQELLRTHHFVVEVAPQELLPIVKLAADDWFPDRSAQLPPKRRVFSADNMNRLYTRKYVDPSDETLRRTLFGAIRARSGQSPWTHSRPWHRRCGRAHPASVPAQRLRRKSHQGAALARFGLSQSAP